MRIGSGYPRVSDNESKRETRQAERQTKKPSKQIIFKRMLRLNVKHFEIISVAYEPTISKI